MGNLTGERTKDSPVRLRFLKFREHCKSYGTFRTSNVYYFRSRGMLSRLRSVFVLRTARGEIKNDGTWGV